MAAAGSTYLYYTFESLKYLSQATRLAFSFGNHSSYQKFALFEFCMSHEIKMKTQNKISRIGLKEI